jgi:hypothetical protein
MSRCDAMCVRRGVVEGKRNRLDGTVGSAEKLVIIRELVKKI